METLARQVRSSPTRDTKFWWCMVAEKFHATLPSAWGLKANHQRAARDGRETATLP